MSEPAAGPNLGLVSGYAPGASNWGTAMNLNLRTLDALGFFMVRVAPLAAPPSGPALGDRYIIAPGATGAWAGKDNYLTVWTTDETNTNLWDFFAPQDGWVARLVPTTTSEPIQVYTFRNGAWNITVSDIPTFSASGTGHMAGLVPDPGAAAGVTRFLREDATWDVPSAGTSGGGGSSWELSDGTHTVTGVTEVLVAGATVSSSGTTSTVATLTVSSSGTSGGGGTLVGPSCMPGIGEAFNWSTGQWKRPALSAMTEFFPASGGGTMVTEEVGSGLSGPIKYLNPGPGMPVLGIPAPTTSQWTVTVLLESLVFATQGTQPGLILFDSNNNCLWTFVFPGSPPQVYLQAGSLSVSGTGTAQSASWNYSSNVANDNVYMTDTLIWLRVRFDGSSYNFEISADGDLWQGYSESQEHTSFFTGTLTGVGVVVSGSSTNYAKIYSFSETSSGTLSTYGTY